MATSARPKLERTTLPANQIPMAPPRLNLKNVTVLLVDRSAYNRALISQALRTVERSIAEEHYAEHKERPFFGDLLEFITSGPFVALAVEGPRAIAAFRQLAGGTDPVEKATPGTIRGDFALETQYNLVHGSDSPESAERELKLWFPEA